MTTTWLALSAVVFLIHSGNGLQLTRGKRHPLGEWTTPAGAEGRKKEGPKPREVLLEGGRYLMGSDDRELLKTGEFPLKNIVIKRFKIDRFPVTNADFKAFKRDKPHFVTDAEDAGYSWVFIRHKIDGARTDRTKKHRDGDHWIAVKNATWSEPFGPGSTIDDKLNCPVVHVSYFDAFSYCSWARKRLVSEYEWEYAARGGVNGSRFPWGNKTDQMRSNTWQGRFPDVNFLKDGYDGVSPVDVYPAQNDFGLHDMIGNVWEWTSTVFTIPRVPNDPDNPDYTVKGGSYLDPYDRGKERDLRNSARLGYTAKYSAANLGFRCGESGRADARTVVRHRLVDTWEYKVRQMLVGTQRLSGQIPDEL